MFSMKFLLFVCCLFAVVSCERSGVPSPKKSGNVRAQVLLDKSKDKAISTEKRLEYLNEALGEIGEDAYDSLALAILHNKSYCHYALDQMDSSHYYDRRILQKALKIGNDYYSARASKDLGIYYDNRQVYDSSYYYHNLSKNYFQKTLDSSQIGRRLLRMGIIQQSQNDHFGAKETLTEALQYLKTTKDENYIASVYNGLGTNNSKLLNHPDAIAYYQKAIAKTNSKQDVISYKNNLAMAFAKKGDYEGAIAILGALLEDSVLDVSSTTYARVLHNHSYAKWRKGIGRQDSPFFEALGIRKAKNDKRGQISSYTDLGEYFSKTDPERAEKYLDTVIGLSRELKIPKAETDALQLLMGLEPKNTAIKDRYIVLKDSLYQQELLVKTQFAKLKYDDEREKERILTLETETAIKNAELIEQRAGKVVYLSLSTLLLLGGTFLYFFMRQKSKKEKLEAVYTTEKKISQRLHDEISNDLYGVMVEVQQQSEPRSLMVLDHLEHIYQRTRSISHDTRAIRTGALFKDELKELFSAFNSDETGLLVRGLKDVDWQALGKHKCIAVYRVMKEILINVKKHSHAQNVVLQFEKQKKLLKISCSDNGVGCGPKQKFGVGLQNTENRIHSIGGTFIFTGSKGKGTRVLITIPC